MTSSSSKRELHSRRLQEGLARIPAWRQVRRAPESADFVAWKQRLKHSLVELFGEGHSYPKRFGNLEYCIPRVIFTSNTPSWTQDDEDACRDDLSTAEALLTEALEELEFTPVTASSSQASGSQVPPSSPIVVQVLNVLSQSTRLDVKQVLMSLDGLGLSHEDRRAAERHVLALETEARGEQRWPIMAKSLEFLKGLGKPVYEKVALPLLLDIIKKQAGL